jgi:hypothetical protein
VWYWDFTTIILAWHAGEPGKKGWGDKVRSRLARIGRTGEQEGPPPAQEPPVGDFVYGAVQAPPSGLSARASLTYQAHGLGTVAEEGAGVAHVGAAAVDAHSASGQAPGGSGAGQAVRQRLTSGLSAVGRGLSKVRTKLGDRQGSGGGDELAQHDQDVAIRVGLAAFAVAGGSWLRVVCRVIVPGCGGSSVEVGRAGYGHQEYRPQLAPAAYIKSVLCPSLAARLGGDSSAGPATPTTLTARGLHHRHTSSLGRAVEAEYMRELDKVRRSSRFGLVLAVHVAAGFVAVVPLLLECLDYCRE